MNSIGAALCRHGHSATIELIAPMNSIGAATSPRILRFEPGGACLTSEFVRAYWTQRATLNLHY